VVATAAGFLIFGLSFAYIGAASVLWVGYVLGRYRWDPEVFERWGFRRAGFGRAAALSAPFAVAALAFTGLWAVSSGDAVINAHLPLLLVLYPPWGAVQQFLVCALVADNLVAIGRGRIRERGAVIIAATLFAAVHAPEHELVVATFFLGLVTTAVYFRTRNLWVPGILHGWFATLVYFFVMGTDPWAQLVLGGFRF